MKKSIFVYSSQVKAGSNGSSRGGASSRRQGSGGIVNVQIIDDYSSTNYDAEAQTMMSAAKSQRSGVFLRVKARDITQPQADDG